MSELFSGQCFLVSGSTRGIGRGIAERLLREGATVGIHGRDPEVVQRLARQFDPERAIAVAADLSDPEQARGMVERFVAATDRIDGLVNNVGGGRSSAFRGISLADWRATFSTNVEAAFVATQAAYVRMRKQKGGAIVNMASLAAHGPGKWMGADYAASKAALVSLTRSLALEAARLNIRCNAISPGFIETDMTSGLPDSARDSLRIPLGRMGSPEDVAGVVSFLLSEDSRYLTGQVLHVDGGLWMNG